jgi:hypothetical protein
MAKPTSAIVSATTPNSGPIVDPKTGNATFAFMKWCQGIGTTINAAFTQQGALSPDSIPFPTPAALGGVVTKGPIAKQWINAIDSTGTPQLSQPAFTDLSGTAAPNQVPPLNQLSGGVEPGQVPALSLLSGSVTATQVPLLSTLNGAVTASQVPALSALSGKITETQLPSAGLSVTVTTAALTVGGTQGSQTFTNGILTAEVAAT